MNMVIITEASCLYYTAPCENLKTASKSQKKIFSLNLQCVNLNEWKFLNRSKNLHQRKAVEEINS